MSTWLLANKCKIRIKNCILRFSKSFGALAAAVADDDDELTVWGIDVGAAAFLSGDLLCKSISMNTGERLRDRTDDDFPLDDEDDLLDELRLGLDGELLGEELFRFDDPDGEPLRA